MTEIDMGRQLAVLATEVRLSRDELSRRFDEQGVSFRELRTEMTTNYVTREHHSSDIGRLTDRVVNTESDLVDLRTQSAASFVELHGHIDRKFDEIGQRVTAQCSDLAAQLKSQQESRRWGWGQAVLIALGLLAAVTTVVLTLAGSN